MRCIKRIVVLSFLFIIVGFLTNALAEGEAKKGILEGTEIEVTGDFAILSKYMWRGIKLDDDPVMQSGVYLSGYGVDLSIWGSTDIDSDDGVTSEEVDYTAGYTYTFNNTPLSVSGGFTYYDFPASDAASREFYLGFGFDVFLSPSLTWYQDFGDEDSGGGSGDYVVAELSHSVDLENVPATFDFNGHVGYNRELFINGDNGGDIGLGAGLTIQLTEKCAFSPSVNYSIPFKDLSDSDDGNYDNEFYGGATLSWSF